MSRDMKDIGMDVHKEAIVIAVPSGSGKLVMESIVETNASSLLQFIHGLRHGMHFVDRGAEFYDAQHRKLQINYLKRKAANLGFQIIAAPARNFWRASRGTAPRLSSMHVLMDCGRRVFIITL